jgi:hypothetical protein
VAASPAAGRKAALQRARALNPLDRYVRDLEDGP